MAADLATCIRRTHRIDAHRNADSFLFYADQHCGDVYLLRNARVGAIDLLHVQQLEYFRPFTYSFIHPHGRDHVSFWHCSCSDRNH